LFALQEKRHGWTVLHFAAYHGAAQAAGALLRLGGRTNSLSKAKQTPGDIARLEGHQDMANLLLRFSSLAKDDSHTQTGVLANEKREEKQAALLDKACCLHPSSSACLELAGNVCYQVTRI